MNLDSAVSIVTGASGGIGRAIAVALAERHGRILVVGRRTSALEATAAAISAHGGEAVTVTGDVADPATARGAVETAFSRGDPQPPAVLEAMLHPDDVARAALWVLTQPDHVRIDDVDILDADNPWRPR
jgi:NADP-dependent 3-hydroxy acid dehydrogenase YdfG